MIKKEKTKHFTDALRMQNLLMQKNYVMNKINKDKGNKDEKDINCFNIIYYESGVYWLLARNAYRQNRA